MADFAFDFPYHAQRMPVLARNAIATSQPLAAQAGLRMLLAGGNAVDAALAAAITLTVVEPTSNGIGSDLFALVWDGTELHGLNASGRSPASWTPDRFAGLSQMPRRGWMSVTVPGAVSGWVALSQRLGKLPFESLFEPAIHYAREGFSVSPLTAAAWETSFNVFKEFESWRETFAPTGRAPKAGELFTCIDQARTLELIAHSHGEAFYRGELAEKIASTSALQSPSLRMTMADLAEHRAEWVEPVAIDYHGIRVHEIPPNGQGIAALMALGILRHVNFEKTAVDSADSIHLQLEAMKLAFSDLHALVSDPASMSIPPAALLDHEYLASRARLINPKRASIPAAGLPKAGGTVYLTAADESGRMVSLIQSNYSGFGSGIVIPGTGIALQNRGFGFVLTPNHPNQVGPRKRPFHTIIPGFVTRNGSPLMSFGVMGGAFQAQGHVQMVTRIFDHGQNPQAASDGPRWQVITGNKVRVEKGFSETVLDALRLRGHEIDLAPATEFGGAQMIFKMATGYLAASDWRKDGQAVGY